MSAAPSCDEPGGEHVEQMEEYEQSAASSEEHEHGGSPSSEDSVSSQIENALQKIAYAFPENMQEQRDDSMLFVWRLRHISFLIAESPLTFPLHSRFAGRTSAMHQFFNNAIARSALVDENVQMKTHHQQATKDTKQRTSEYWEKARAAISMAEKAACE